MKKSVFILVAVLVSSFVIKGQNSNPPNNYFLPDYIDVDFCSSAFNYYNENELCVLTRGHFHFLSTGQGNSVLDRAQPCYTDTLLTIQGVAVGVNLTMNILEEYILSEQYMTPQAKIKLISSWEAYFNFATASKGKLKIMNSTLDRELASVDIDTNFIFRGSQNYSYIEFYFDNPINMNGLFYIVEDVTITSTRLNNVLFVKDCQVYDPSLVRAAEDTVTPWVLWEEQPFHDLGVASIGYGHWDLWGDQPGNASAPIPNTCQMYFFPIFAETDSTLGDGINFDTNDSMLDRHCLGI